MQLEIYYLGMSASVGCTFSDWPRLPRVNFLSISQTGASWQKMTLSVQTQSSLSLAPRPTVTTPQTCENCQHVTIPYTARLLDDVEGFVLGLALGLGHLDQQIGTTAGLERVYPDQDDRAALQHHATVLHRYSRQTTAAERILSSLSPSSSWPPSPGSGNAPARNDKYLRGRAYGQET